MLDSFSCSFISISFFYDLMVRVCLPSNVELVIYFTVLIVYTLNHTVVDVLCALECLILTLLQLLILRCCLLKHVYSHFVTSSCDVRHNDDGICQIASLVSSIPVDSPVNGTLNFIHRIISKQQRCPCVVCIVRRKGYRSITSSNRRSFNKLRMGRH